MKPKILMIVGYPRSGSTVLGELINKENGFIHVGELERLWYLRNNPLSILPQVSCSCKNKMYNCDFWSPYCSILEEKIYEISKRENLELNNRILLNYRNQYIKKGKWKVKEARIYSEINFVLYSALYNTEQKIIVDSSKELWYAQYLEQTGSFDITYIHLIRDLRGVVLSRQRKMKKNEEESGKISLNYPYLLYDSMRWNLTNWKIKKFLRGRKNMQVSYEGFLQYPGKLLKEIGSLTNSQVAPNLILNRENEFIINENHVIHGNKFRFTRGMVKLKEDERWKSQLKKMDQKLLRNLDLFTAN